MVITIRDRCYFLPTLLLQIIILLLLNRLHTLPAALELLLEQPDPVIARAHGQDVPAQAPAGPPRDSVKVESRRLPLAGRVGRGRRPDADGLVLGGGRDVGL